MSGSAMWSKMYMPPTAALGGTLGLGFATAGVEIVPCREWVGSNPLLGVVGTSFRLLVVSDRSFGLRLDDDVFLRIGGGICFASS